MTKQSFFFSHFNLLREDLYHVSQDEAINLLDKEEKRLVQVLEDGMITAGYDAPKKLAAAEPGIRRMEVYIIASGNTIFTEIEKLFNVLCPHQQEF